MTDVVMQGKPDKVKKSNWWWRGVVATGLAGAAVMAIRGCWHSRMSWPVAIHGHSYQVCLACGAMRLFDENKFRAYGPVRYDLNALIAWEDARTGKSGPHADETRLIS